MNGQTLSHYRIVEQLGDGGMGVVYKAVDTRLNRTVALKFLSPELVRDADANLRFRQEAQAASALDHPNICTFHEIDETADGRVFLAMAYYEGETLRQRLQRGPLPLADAIDIAMQVASGLSKVHAVGIVHRDIKPANLIITSDGLVKILDFGIAKMPGQPELTRTGTTLGTVAYMAPEQITGVGVDQRSDVWSLGAVLYEAIAGRPPFGRENEIAQVTTILTEDPAPLRTLREHVPEALERVVTRALQKRPDARYATAADVHRDLRDCQIAARDRGHAVAVDAPARRRRTMLVLAAAVLVLFGSAGLWTWTRSVGERRAREVLLPEIARLADKGQYVAAFALAEQAETHIPTDPLLTELWSRISAKARILATPARADVYFREYSASDSEWKYVGRTPLNDVRLPQGLFQWRIEKPAFDPLLFVGANPSDLLRNLNVPGPERPSFELSLLQRGAVPEGMVLVPAGTSWIELNGFGVFDTISLQQFFIDQHEVTNREFKEFVNAAGYSTARYWAELPFVKDGRELPWKAATDLFVDATGRPGPATWELSDYHRGQDDLPVGGVSWYEAAAYCTYREKTLPTLYHWARAGTSGDAAPAMIALSNFAGEGLAPVEKFRGIGPYGTYDTAGNAREWVWNASAANRWILGGAWN